MSTSGLKDCEILRIKISGKVTEVVVGRTESMQKLCRDAEVTAKHDLPVLITGETGVGKEWLASMIHSSGNNFFAPFVDVNCGAITSPLMESLFFGHEKGAFTGASQARDGYFSQVGSGTIFLDEIGELPMELQPKLLRVLETGLFRPVGASKNIKFRGRVVAATHRDLEKMVKVGEFREDLLHRLNVLTLKVPNLVERKNDIPLLVDFFLSKSSKNIRLTDCAVSLLKEQEWRGNIRQLRNTIEKICVFSSEGEMNATSLRSFLPYSGCCMEAQLRRIASEILDLNIANKMVTIESLLIKQALARYGGNKTRAAEELGLHRKVLERRVKSMTTSVEALVEEVSKIRELQREAKHIKVIEAVNSSYAGSINLSGCRDVLEIRYELLKLRCLSEREVYGWNASCVMETYREIVKFCHVLNDSAKTAFYLFGMWSVHLINNELAEALVIAEQLQCLSEEGECQIIKCKAAIALAKTLFWMGQFEDSKKNLVRFKELHDYNLDMINETGVDLLPFYLFLKGLSGCLSGHFNSAYAVVRRLVDYVSDSTHFFSNVISYQALATIEFLFSHYENANSYALKLIELTKDMKYKLYHGRGLIYHGVYMSRYCREKGEAIMSQGIMECRGGDLFIPFYCLIRAKVLMEKGCVCSALEQLSEGLKFAASGQNYVFYPELLFFKSVCMAESGVEGYENGLYEAYRLVKEQGNKFVQLRILYFCLKKKLKVTALFLGEDTFYDEAEAFLNQFSEDEHHLLLDYVRFRIGWGMRGDL